MRRWFKWLQVKTPDVISPTGISRVNSVFSQFYKQIDELSQGIEEIQAESARKQQAIRELSLEVSSLSQSRQQAESLISSIESFTGGSK